MSLIIYSDKAANLKSKIDLPLTKSSVLFFELALMGNCQRKTLDLQDADTKVHLGLLKSLIYTLVRNIFSETKNTTEQ